MTEWPMVAYALALIGASLFVERFYCRFACPLGGGLSIMGRVRMFNWLHRHPECGSRCRHCEAVCPVGAIKQSGEINMNECFYCLDDSDTRLALLSGAPFDDPSWWLLSNEQIVKARDMVNDFAGSRRLLAHTVITPKQPGWMDEVDKAISTYKPDSWKSYTIGDPLAPTKFPWRLDDEKLMYPFCEKAVKSGITTICIHKGLLPPDYEKSFAGVWQYA